MAEAECRQRWSHTSSILAMLANAHRDPKKSRPFKPADFNPYQRTNEGPNAQVAKVGVQVLKQLFVDVQPRR
ncbi:MAG: hypothetical protein K8T89_04340 [Planctomycetes bacterium]|nr:hypothetical protein [Planctomycetota bacterium]